MNFYELCLKRFSCRKFKDHKVEREKILKCIDAARLSPSACNSQPWRFIVVDDEKLVKKIAEVATQGIYGVINKFLFEVPCIIVVAADKEKFIARLGGRIVGTQYYLIDIGIASEHLVLQAQELGLGTCYIGYFNEKGIKKILNIPENFKVPLLIAIGYPDNIYKEEDIIKIKFKARKKLSEIVYFNNFKNK
ncbi:MAG: nitroreductase family protein [Candidatus Hydrothermales bacterium]